VTPCGVHAAAIKLFHLLHCGIRADFNPVESGVALPPAKAGARLVVVGFGGAVAAEAAAGPAVAQVGDGVCKRGDGIGLPGMRALRKASGKDVLEFTDALFDGTVVRRVIRRAVERDHAMKSQQLVDSVMIEDAAIVPLEEQRLAMPGEKMIEVSGYLMTRRVESNQRFKAIAGSEVLGGDKEEFPARLVPSIFGGVNAPCKVGFLPRDPLPSPASLIFADFALPADHAGQLTARDRGFVLLVSRVVPRLRCLPWRSCSTSSRSLSKGSGPSFLGPGAASRG